jgi:predicted DNA-binding protein with PD1-like motif
MKKSFNTLMEDYRILIWNAEDPTIKAKIEPFGYTTVKLDEGKALYGEVQTLAETQRVEYAEQYTSSTLFIENRQLAEDELHKWRKFSKYAFREIPEAFNVLKLSGEMPRNFADWQQSAKYFYERLQEHPDWITSLELFGLTAEIVTQNIVAISELNTMQENRQRETGDAQRATLARNAKFDELKEWYIKLRDLAKLLFEDEDAQYLEKLGILVRS